MSALAEGTEAMAAEVSCSRYALSVTLTDGRIVSVPLVWFPWLAEASAQQRADFELIGGGIGVHWEVIDEDISVASLLHPENLFYTTILSRSNLLQGRGAVSESAQYRVRETQ